jgi:hypothetical protein
MVHVTARSLARENRDLTTTLTGMREQLRI